MYKIKWVYICDICQKVGLPVEYPDTYGTWKGPPEHWHTVEKYHYCDECYETVMKIKIEKKIGIERDKTYE